MRKALILALSLLFAAGMAFGGGSKESSGGGLTGTDQLGSNRVNGNTAVNIYSGNTDTVSLGVIPTTIGDAVSTFTEKICLSVTPFPGALSYFDDQLVTPKDSAKPESTYPSLSNISLFQDGYFDLPVANSYEGDNQDANSFFLSTVTEQTAETREAKQKTMWSITLILFASFLAAESIFQSVMLYMKGEDGIIKKIASKILISMLFLLLASCLPFVVEAFKYGFTKLAYYAMGQKSAFDKDTTVFQLPKYFCDSFAKVLNQLNPNNIGGAGISILGADQSVIGKLLVNMLYMIVNLLGCILVAFGAFQIMLNIIEVYLLLALSVILIPFSVFTPLSFLGSGAVKALLSNMLDLFVMIVIAISTCEIGSSITDYVLERMLLNTTYATIEYDIPVSWLRDKADAYGVNAPYATDDVYTSLESEYYYNCFWNGVFNFSIDDKNAINTLIGKNENHPVFNIESKAYDPIVGTLKLVGTNYDVFFNLFFTPNKVDFSNMDNLIDPNGDDTIHGVMYLAPWDEVLSYSLTELKTNKNGSTQKTPTGDYNESSKHQGYNSAKTMDPNKSYIKAKDKDERNIHFNSLLTPAVKDSEFGDTARIDPVGATIVNWIYDSYASDLLKVESEYGVFDVFNASDYAFSKSMVTAQLEKGDSTFQGSTIDEKLADLVKKTPFTRLPNVDKLSYISRKLNAIINSTGAQNGSVVINTNMRGSFNDDNEFAMIVFHLVFSILAIIIPVYFVKQAPHISNAIKSGASMIDPFMANQGFRTAGGIAGRAVNATARTAVSAPLKTGAMIGNLGGVAADAALKKKGYSADAWQRKLAQFGAGRLREPFTGGSRDEHQDNRENSAEARYSAQMAQDEAMANEADRTIYAKAQSGGAKPAEGKGKA